MSERTIIDGLVINSNLAQPIAKKAGAPNPGQDVFSLRHYVGRTLYFPAPAIDDIDQVPHLALPEIDQLDVIYGVFGFRIPDTIRMRIASFEPKTEALNEEEQELVDKLTRLGRGATFEIPEPETIEFTPMRASPAIGVLRWNVAGEAFSDDIEGSVRIDVTGAPGHRITPKDKDHPGIALLQTISTR